MRLKVAIVSAAILLAGCDQPAATSPVDNAPAAPVATEPAPSPTVINLATPDTTDGAMPNGWSYSLAGDKHVYARQDDIYFEFDGGVSQLTYVVAAEVAGDIALDYGWEIEGINPVCLGSIVQGTNQASGPSVSGPNKLSMRKEAGSTALASITCKADGKSTGWLRKPTITVARPVD